LVVEFALASLRLAWAWSGHSKLLMQMNLASVAVYFEENKSWEQVAEQSSLSQSSNDESENWLASSLAFQRAGLQRHQHLQTAVAARLIQTSTSAFAALKKSLS
jgi:hypothetical protein